MPSKRSFPTAIGACLGITFLVTVAWADDSPPVTAEAKTHFQAGVKAMQRDTPDGHAEAYREFKAAYAASPTPKILGNLGQAADELERDGEAIDALEEYLARVKDIGSPKIAAQLRADLDRLRGNMAVVSIEAPGTIWVVDTRRNAEGNVTNQYGPFDGRATLRVRAGQHEFQLEGPSASAAPWAVTLLPGDSVEHVFAPEPPKTDDVVSEFDAASADEPDRGQKPPSHTASYLLWAGGAAGAVASTVFYLESNRIQDNATEEYGQRCPLGASVELGCEETPHGLERAANWRTASLVTGAAALGAIVGGTVLYLLAAPSSQTSGQSQEASLNLWFTPTGGGLSGTF